MYCVTNKSFLFAGVAVVFAEQGVGRGVEGSVSVQRIYPIGISSFLHEQEVRDTNSSSARSDMGVGEELKSHYQVSAFCC